MPTERTYVRDMPPAVITADELRVIRIPDKRVELVRGVLVVREPAGLPHGRVAMELGRRLANHVAAHGLGGRVYAAETGFTLACRPDTVRAPDIAFVLLWAAPRSRTHGVSRSRPVASSSTLDGEDVVPGFSCLLHVIL